MRSTARLACLVVGTVAVACADSASQLPAQGQIVLAVDTDAPLPPPGGTLAPDPTQPLPLFDRLRIDWLPPGQSAPCADCTNDFAVDAQMLQQRLASVGFVPPAGDDGWTARVRLYLGRFADAEGNPDPASTIDVAVSLPAVGADGVEELSVTLRNDDVGRPVAPVAATPGTVGTSAVGTWPGAKRSSCTGGPHDGQACVPGGAFWMGDPGDYLVPGVTPGWRRLVVMSPFFVDSFEVTAGDYRAHGPADEVLAWTGGTSGASQSDWCTYAAQPGARDVLPVTCVTWIGASAYCDAVGATLPTEAQLEYLISGLAGQTYVWGNDLPACGDAVMGRGGFAALAGFTSPCSGQGFLGAMGGPEPPGQKRWDARDVLSLPGGVVWDLAGNVSEWTADDYQTDGEPCWSAAGVMHDPACLQPSPSLGVQAATRGGNWELAGIALSAPDRAYQAPTGATEATGFRCARADGP